jgi:hypothetical protein
MWDQPAQNPALILAPKFPLLVRRWAAAFACDDEHVAMALALATGEEAAERGVGVVLAHPVKIEPGADFPAATGDAFGRAPVERLRRRREGGLPIGGP